MQNAKTVAEAWEGKFACPEYELVMKRIIENLLHLDFEDGTSFEATGAEIYELCLIVDNLGLLVLMVQSLRTRKKVLFQDY